MLPPHESRSAKAGNVPPARYSPAKLSGPKQPSAPPVPLPGGGNEGGPCLGKSGLIRTAVHSPSSALPKVPERHEVVDSTRNRRRSVLPLPGVVGRREQLPRRPGAATSARPAWPERCRRPGRGRRECASHSRPGGGRIRWRLLTAGLPIGRSGLPSRWSCGRCRRSRGRFFAAPPPGRLECSETAPPIALRPNSVPCGPRSTSTRSTSTSSMTAPTERAM